MVLDVATSPREDLRSRVQATFARRLIFPEECVDPVALSQMPEDLRDAVTETHDWITNFVTQRVNKHGRREAICPFVEPSLQREAMFLSIATPDQPNEIASIDRELRHFSRIFHELEPKAMPAAIVKTVVAIFPQTRGPLLLEATDASRDLKGDLLEDGILVGEFFSTCPFATTFNPRLYALRSPRPMYVLRSFIDTDWRFIAQVPRWREIYRARFGDPPADSQHLGTLRGRVIGKLRSLSVKLGAKPKRPRRR